MITLRLSGHETDAIGNVEALHKYMQGRFSRGGGARLPENLLFFYLPLYWEIQRRPQLAAYRLNCHELARCLGLAAIKLRVKWVLFEREKRPPTQYNYQRMALGVQR